MLFYSIHFVKMHSVSTLMCFFRRLCALYKCCVCICCALRLFFLCFFSFLRCIIRICVNGLDFYFHLGELELQTQPTVRQIPVLLRCLPFNIICVHQSIAGCTFFFVCFILYRLECLFEIAGSWRGHLHHYCSIH